MKPKMSSKVMKDALSDEEIAEVDFEGEMINALKELENLVRRTHFLKRNLQDIKNELKKPKNPSWK